MSYNVAHMCEQGIRDQVEAIQNEILKVVQKTLYFIDKEDLENRPFLFGELRDAVRETKFYGVVQAIDEHMSEVEREAEPECYDCYSEYDMETLMIEKEDAEEELESAQIALEEKIVYQGAALTWIPGRQCFVDRVGNTFKLAKCDTLVSSY